MSKHLERTYFRNGIVMSLLLVLLFFVTDFPSFALAKSTDVIIINLLYDTDVPADPYIAAYELGFNYSLLQRNFTLAGRKVNMIKMTPSLDNVSSSIEKVVGFNPELFLVLGPGTEKITNAAYTALEKKDVIAFGPLSTPSFDRKFDKYLYFFLANRELTTYTFLRHTVNNMRARRIGVMYTKDASFGYAEYAFLNKLMKGMNRKFSGVFNFESDVPRTENKEFNMRWEAFAKTHPQVVFVLGAKNNATKLFIRKLLKDPRTKSTALMLANEEIMILDLWEEQIASKASIFEGHMFISTTYRDVLDAKSARLIDYQPTLKAHSKGGVGKLRYNAKGKLGGQLGGSAAMAGRIAGEILSQALTYFNSERINGEFISSLYEQQTYFFADEVIGTFGGNISEEVKKTGGVSFCSQGGRSAYMWQYSAPSFEIYVPEGKSALAIEACHSDNLTLADSASIVTVNFTDIHYVKDYMINEITKGQETGVFYRTPEAKHDMKIKVLESNHNAGNETLQRERKNYWTNIVTGVIAENMLDIPKLAFIDPFIMGPRINKFRKNVVFLSPTLEQQMYVLAQYVSTLPDPTVRPVTRTASEKDVLNVLKKSFETFTLKLNSSVLLGAGDKIKNVLATSGLTMVLEVDKSDIGVFVAHLTRHKNARIAILFNSFAAFYNHLFAAFKGNEAADRLLFLTNLPHWADASSSSRIIRSYHESIANPAMWSPASLQSFIVGRVIRSVVEDLPTVNSYSVLHYFYATPTVQLGEMVFGPFTDSRSVKCKSESHSNSLACVKNFGATSISAWPMSRVFDPNVGVVFGPVTPSIQYTSNVMSRGKEAGIILVSFLIVAVVAAVAGLLLYFFCMGDFNTPKNPADPITLVFTDIKSSTALWTECPEIMPEAVEMHHRIIRQLISNYRCYEVKTIGDSFMIACKSASDAVQFVEELQRTFLQQDWGTNAIDEAYRKFEEAQAEEDADYKPPTARLDDDEYREHWNGLRVHAGVHTGLCDIWYDEVRKGYDYYGSTTKTAARTESVANGGQVLLTHATLMALRAEERMALDVTDLGAVELRGVPEPVRMFQLNAVPGRVFGKLQLDRGVDKCDFERSTLALTTTSVPVSETLIPSAENVYVVLDDICARFPPHLRLKVLEPFCKKWNVTIPDASNEKEMLAASRLAQRRLAMKSYRVIERIHTTRDSITDASGTLSSRGGLLMRNTPNPFRQNMFLKPLGFQTSQDSEGSSESTLISVTPILGSYVSDTVSIQVEEPSFISIE